MPAPPDSGLAKLVPGFDFLQGLARNATSALPGIGQWIAPTLDPEEIEKRITELRTVQFWLEQNARLLGTTIQALEVQRMTLSTLKTMNVPVASLRDSLQAGAAAPPDTGATPRRKAGPKAQETVPAPGMVDPMQWWGALTQQFNQLAASAMKDALKEGASEGARTLATQLVKQGVQAAEQTLKAGVTPLRKATEMAGAVARQAGRRGAGPVAGGTTGGTIKGTRSAGTAARRRRERSDR